MTTGAPQRCIVCNVPPRLSFRLSAGQRLLRCPRCGLGWWNWSAFDARHFYDRAYFESDEAAKGYASYASLETGLRRTSRARLRRIERLLRSPPTGRALLDFGCGTGAFLDEARAAGWSAEGVEVSAFAAGQARRRGHRVVCETVGRIDLPHERFACVTLWDTLEHLADPMGAIEKASRALTREGVLAFSTGDITSLCARLSGPHWHLFNLPEHLFFFSPRALRLLLSRAGLHVVRWTREVNWAPVSYLAERLAKTLPGTGRVVGPLCRLRRVMPATLFDVLGVYAVRPA